MTLKKMLFIGLAVMIIVTAALGTWALISDLKDARDAESCEYEINLIGTTARGFHYTEPERGHCWDCRSDGSTMSDSAMRVCDRRRKDGEEYKSKL